MSSTTVDSTAAAYRWIRDRILTGEMPPGSVVSQVRLAGELRISRTPLREALRQLSAEGLVISDFNRRIRISELDLDDFDEIYAMRLALEPVGVGATVPRLSTAQQAELSEHVSEMGEAIGTRDLDRFRVHHKGFHLGLVSGCGRRMIRTITELWDHSERYRLAYLHLDQDRDDILAHERFRISQDEHEQILAAALAGQSETCSDRLVAHLQRTVDGVYREATRARRPVLSDHVVAALHHPLTPVQEPR